VGFELVEEHMLHDGDDQIIALDRTSVEGDMAQLFGLRMSVRVEVSAVLPQGRCGFTARSAQFKAFARPQTVLGAKKA
jgi:hypothetical protein